MTTRKPAATKADESAASSSDTIMSIRLEGAMHERLRKLAFDRREPMRSFIVKGITLVLEAEGY